jgi:alkylation response protein AidB-like acyl-CoA dehydrogenase
MHLLPSPEQTEIIDSSSAFLAAHMSVTRTRELFEAGTTPAVSDEAWAAAANLGWFALGLPEERNGIGCGLADEMLLFREIGRVIAPGPFLSTLLGARVAAFGGDQALADEIIAGRRVGLVIPSSLDAIAADGSVVGDVQLVDADVASEDGLVLVATATVAALIDLASLTNVREMPCLDPTARLHRAGASGAAPRVAVAASVDAVERRGHVLAAAMLAGITEWSRDTASEHAKNRVQFDKPIGVNQAIKHPCADMAVQAQLAYSQALFASLAIDEGRPDAEFQALSAHLTASAAAEFATSATLQVMGGMGFTHEHDVHLYVKRMDLLSFAFGAPTLWLSRLLELPEAV